MSGQTGMTSLRERREAIRRAGGADKLASRREKGLMNARERIDALCQPYTFQESGAHVQAAPHAFAASNRELPADAVICGTGYVDGRPVAVISQDFTVVAGTLGKAHAQKIVDTMKIAAKLGIPFVAFKDSGGARIQEGVDALSGYGHVFYHNVLISGVVPQIAVIAGPCAGGAAYSPALMDFVIMIEGHARMFITGPEVIKAVTGRETSMEEIGGSAMHASISGNAHLIAKDDRHAVDLVRRLLSYLPSSNTEDPPHAPFEDMVLETDGAMDELVPADPTEAMDVRAVIDRVVDDGSFLEIHNSWACNLIVGFARIEGMVVGLLANQPTVNAGALDINASDKGSRFIRTCNVFNVPLVTLVDVPGFLPGVEQERGGIIRHGAKMLYAYAAATVPKLTVILRKAYGGSYLAMCSQEMGADFVFAWPNSEIAVMGAEGAVKVLYRNVIRDAEDPRAKARELAATYRSEFASPYMAASRGYITDVIEPSETRWMLALALRKTLTKRELRPPKKHGNNPM